VTRTTRSAALMAVLLVAGLALTAGTAAAAPGKTLDNLQTAFNGESNANAKYLEFARKADQEGYAGVASLFRAAAKAEEFHARNHAEVIKKLGGTPKADIKPPVVKTTADNVKVAIEGEVYERDTMYPEFIAEAKASGQNDALRSFNFAIAAEAQHAALYTEASAGLASWKAARTFYVCPLCGHTGTRLVPTLCPVCATAKDKFLKIK